ncbi:MAG: patatin-like phospholipase family protein [Synechococcaceae cyanobacterium]|nr:patatin-like phospholipase family protein [Synechococcaceae cyanobacterium]
MSAHCSVAEACAASSLFQGVEASQVLALGVQPQPFKAGQWLFGAGDPADRALIVLSGIIGLFEGPPEAAGVCFRRACRGELIGEYGLLCEQPRSASALALSDGELLSLNRGALEGLLALAPMLQQRLIRQLARGASRGRQADPARPLTLVLLNLQPQSPLTAAAERSLLQADGDSLLVDAPGVTDSEQLEQLLAEALQRQQPTLIRITDAALLNPRNRLLIDRLVLLIEGEQQALLSEGARQAQALPARGTLLVRLWPAAQPRPHSRGLPPMNDALNVLNIRPEQPADLARLRRCVRGNATVLVLGGGGARGFAHVGALAAFSEPAPGASGAGRSAETIDMVLGVSFGALVASLHAFGCTPAEIYAHLERVIIRSRPYALALPLHGLFNLEPSRRALQTFFDGAQVQDSWIPWRSFSTNISRNRLQAWSHGDVCDAVIASLSVPGIFPPLIDQRGERHVDGGLLDNLPVQAARALSHGQIIAISLDADPEASTGEGAEGAASIARTLVDAMMSASHAHSRRQEKLATLLLRPAIAAYPFLDWRHHRAIHDEGYRCARQQLAARTESVELP